MNPFRNDPPIIYRAPGYQVDLDRLQPVRGAGCGRVLLLLLAAGSILSLVCGGLYLFVRSQTMPPETEMPLTLAPSRVPVTATLAPVLDSWSLTGTALIYATASPTLDYCYFLTPSPVPTLTPLPVTPDAWALQGTAYALETGTPTFTPYPLPTQQPPRAWCDLVLTPTFTPFALPQSIAEATQEAAPPPTSTPKLPTKEPTLTPFPEIKIPDTHEQPAPVQSSRNVNVPDPVIIVQTQVRVIHETAAPPPPAVTELVVVTATLTPTFTATPTETATDTPTETPTETATDTPIDVPAVTQEALP